jgi:stage II sporulation protein AA (anti-sigma F factor antagonist)
MAIRTRNDRGAVVVEVSGRLDAVTAPEFETTLNASIQQGNLRHVINLDGLEYVSSAGLRGILVIAKLLRSKGGQLRFANVRGTVREVFDISGFGSILTIDESVAAALDGLA